ncbi:hypothetical protein PM082_021298 [Marasmius tenuissimus]|nr:hypothetical protein PM082_021298 [Marasmius tenuissimus]
MLLPNQSRSATPAPEECPLYDPRLELMPDFANDWQTVIDTLVSNGSDCDEALASIQASWQNRHNRRIATWDAKIESERITAEEEERRQKDNKEERSCLALQQRQADLAEAEKKKPKIGDFDENCALPSSVPLRASNFALNKVRNKDYIELYHWTKQAMDKNALLSPTLSSTNTFTIANGDDGNLTLLPTLAHQNSKHVIPPGNTSLRQSLASLLT